jgi:hypothetical protein
MAKTYKNLFNKIIDAKNLVSAFHNASEGKRYRATVMNFEKNLGRNILLLQQELLAKQYQPGNYHFFYLFDPKKRKISAAPFRDRIVHHAVYRIIEPIFNEKFIFDSFACRQVKGSHRAVNRLQKFLITNIRGISERERERERERETIYCLKCDVSKCFPSVNHNILIQILKKKIKEENTIWLLEQIIKSYETDDEHDNLFPPNSHFRICRPRGIPIGNLTSQIFINIYLNELDQYVKHQLKVRYYVRYVDDFIILSKDKRYLQELTETIRTFLYDKLYLTLHPKKVSISPSDKGIDFLGYVIFKEHILLRTRNVKSFRKRLKKYRQLYLDSKTDKEKEEKEKKIMESITAWLAHAEHADTYQLRKSIFGTPLVAKNQKEIKEFIQSWEIIQGKPIP